MKHPVSKIILSAVFLMSLIGFTLTAEEKMPNFLKDAKVGEWALYSMPTTPGMQMKQTVIKVTPKRVTLKTEMIMSGKAMNTSQQIIPLTGKAPKIPGAKAGAKPKISKGTVKVKDKELECIIMEVEASTGSQKSKMSKDVPVTGMVSTENNGKVMMKLIDYGTK